MKSKSPNLLFAGLVTAAVLSFSTVAKAGPGIDYWRRVDTARDQQTKAEETPAVTKPCTDAKIVEITETKKDWPNGKGPLVTTVVGQKVQCTACGKTTTVTKRTWLNGKGPTVSEKVRSTHDCDTCGDYAKS